MKTSFAKYVASIAIAFALCGCALFETMTIDQKAALAKSATTVATAVVVQTKVFTPEVKTVSIDVAMSISNELTKVTSNGYEFYKNIYPIADNHIEAKLSDANAKSTARILATTVLNILDTIQVKYKVDNIIDIKIIASSVIEGYVNGVNYQLTNDEKLSVARFSAKRLGVPEPDGTDN